MVGVLHSKCLLRSLQIREEIEQYGIKIYEFPDCDSDEDEDFKQQDLQLKVNRAPSLKQHRLYWLVQTKPACV